MLPGCPVAGGHEGLVQKQGSRVPGFKGSSKKGLVIGGCFVFFLNPRILDPSNPLLVIRIQLELDRPDKVLQRIQLVRGEWFFKQTGVGQDGDFLVEGQGDGVAGPGVGHLLLASDPVMDLG